MPDKETAMEIGKLALAGAMTTHDQGFKTDLGQLVVARAIIRADRCPIRFRIPSSFTL